MKVFLAVERLDEIKEVDEADELKNSGLRRVDNTVIQNNNFDFSILQNN